MTNLAACLYACQDRIVIFDNADFVLSVTTGDFDRDGDVDVASASYFDGSIRWFENLGNSREWLTHEIYRNPIGQGHYVFAVDMDSDGDEDLVATTMAENTISIFIAETGCDSSLVTPQPACCSFGFAWNGTKCAPCPQGLRASLTRAGVCEPCDAPCNPSGYAKQPQTCSAHSRCTALAEPSIRSCDCAAHEYLDERSQCARCKDGMIKPRHEARDGNSLANAAVWTGFSEESCCVAATATAVIPADCTAHATREVTYVWSNPNCTGNLSLPEPSSLPCEYQPIGSSVVSAVFALSLVLSVLVVALTIGIGHYRAEPIVQRSQWSFQMIMGLGSLLALCSIFLLPGEPSGFRCYGFPILFNVSFTLLFGTMGLKTWRIYRIFEVTLRQITPKESTKSVGVTITDGQLYKYLTLIMAVDALILSLQFIVSPPRPERVAVLKPPYGEVLIDRCHPGDPRLEMCTYVWKGLIAMALVTFAFKARHVIDEYGESRYIFITANQLLVCSTVALLVTTLIKDDSTGNSLQTE